jgi:hypothetical protein
MVLVPPKTCQCQCWLDFGSQGSEPKPPSLRLQTGEHWLEQGQKEQGQRKGSNIIVLQRFKLNTKKLEKCDYHLVKHRGYNVTIW